MKTVPDYLVQRVEDYALSLGVNTTNAYIILLNQALDYKDTLNNLPALLDLISEYKTSTLENEKERK